jgi:hypothetical protein
MGWEDLLQEEDERITAPWVGGKSLKNGSRRWKITGSLPKEHGWYEWRLTGRKAELVGDAEVDSGGVSRLGYLVGDLFVSDGEGGEIKNPRELMGRFERVHLLEALDHFDRISVRRFWDDGPLIFVGQGFPLGPESDVLSAFLDRKASVDDIPEVAPALDLCFRMKVWHREWVEVKREEERIRREKEERARRLREQLGDGATRRELAKEDFATAAKAALAIGGAEYIEHRRAARKGEYAVRYRLDGARYECVCDINLHIVDAGICLTDHGTGEKGDTYFTLESMPGVTRQAMDEGAAIWRHV